jgi:type IV pilus assembly protein PilM
MIHFGFNTQSCGPIGLDIGTSSIKMVQLAVNNSHIKLLAADVVHFDPEFGADEKAREDFIVSAVKKMRIEAGFRGKNVVTCLPNDKVMITSLRLTEPEGVEIERALRKEAVQRFGLDPSQDCINYVRAGDVSIGEQLRTELILFAVANSTIKNNIEMIERTGLVPVGIDVVPCALFRSFERSLRRQEDKEKTVVFIDVGSQHTTVVFGRGGEISFVKQIPIAGDRFNKEVSEKLVVSVSEAQMLRASLQKEKSTQAETSEAAANGRAEQNGLQAADGVGIDASTRQGMVDAISAVAEQLAREISLCFRYYTVTFRGKRIESANITGGGSNETILLNVLRRHLTVDVVQAQPFRGFDMSQGDFETCRRGLYGEWAVAVGLALKGSSQDSKRDE